MTPPEGKAVTDDKTDIDIKQVWADALEQLERNISARRYRKWVEPLVPIDLDDDGLLLRAPDDFHKVHVSEGEDYRELIENTTGHPLRLTTEGEEAPAQATLPLVRPEHAPIPNDMLRSALFGVVKRGRRKQLKQAEIASWPTCSIAYTGEQLDQNDLDVWLQCLRLMRDEEMGEAVHFTRRGFLKALQRSLGGAQYAWLDRSLDRLTASAVHIKIGSQKYVGSLVHEYYLDEDTGRFAVVLNEKLLPLFSAGYTKVEMEQRLQLSGSLTTWLHGYILTQQATGEDPHRIGLGRVRELSGSSVSYLRNFRAEVRKSMDDIEDVGTVVSWSIIDDVLRFVRPTENALLD